MPKRLGMKALLIFAKQMQRLTLMSSHQNDKDEPFRKKTWLTEAKHMPGGAAGRRRSVMSGLFWMDEQRDGRSWETD